MKVKMAPLNSTFMLVSILGFFISIWFIIPELSLSWGFAFMIVFIIMFFSSLISMTTADTGYDDLDALAIKQIKKK